MALARIARQCQRLHTGRRGHEVIRKASVCAAVVLGFAVGAPHAQGMMRVNVPFAFVVGQNQFAAGQYEIREIDGAANVIAIEGISDPSSFGFVLTNSAYGK